MTVVVTTADAAGLLASIKKSIDDGHIDTWEYDKEGDFTHNPPQWINKAWLRPDVSSGVLKFSIISPKSGAPTQQVLGVYHGRFIEMLFTHFPTEFTAAAAKP